MAPAINLDFLTKRQFYGGGECNYYDNDCYYESNWSRWGRWVLLGCIIVVFVILAFLMSCINARRRRRQGLPPRYGTGFLAGKTPVGHNAPQYNGYYQGQGPSGAYNGAGAAPPYSPPVNNQTTGNTFNSNDGYYGQQSGIELQQPQNSYAPQRGGDPVYNAPQGPPPKRGYNNDGIIR